MFSMFKKLFGNRKKKAKLVPESRTFKKLQLAVDLLEDRFVPATTLGVGDIAFTGYQAANPDAFSFVALKDIESGTTLTFTDNGWLGAQTGFRTGEGTTTLTFGSNITAGTQIRFTADAAAPAGFYIGSGNGTSAGTHTALTNFSFNASNDSLLVYQGAAPTSGSASNWVAALQQNSGGSWDADATSASTSAKPTIFTDGDTSLVINQANAIVNSTMHPTITGTPAGIRSIVHNLANLNLSSSVVNPPPATTFTVSSGTVAPTISSANHATFTIGIASSFTFSATGNPTPTLSLNGTLPSGLAFNTTSGVLSGTPANGTDANYNLTFTAANGVGSNATQNFTLSISPGFISYSTAGATYSQNFNSLPTSATPGTTVLVSGNGPLELAATPFEGANMTGWYAAKHSGTGGSLVSRIDDGSTSGGSFNNYGSLSSNDRAIGSVGSSTSAARFGAVFVNNTNATLNEFTLQFTGEQWRSGDTALVSNTLTFGYQIGAVDVNTGTFTPVSSLNFSSIHLDSPAGPLDGNLDGVIQNATVSGFNWSPGQTLVIRWDDTDDSGQDDGLAIDDFTFSAISLTPTAPTITSANATTFIHNQPGSFTVTSAAIPAANYTATGLPGWLSLNTTTGVLSGTPPTVVDPQIVNLTIQADNGVAPVANQTFTLTLAPTTIAYTTPGSNYTQNFDGLPMSGSALTFPNSGPFGVTGAPISATGMHGWYVADQLTNAVKYTVDDGNSSTGSAMSYGSVGSSERALGSLASGSSVPTFGAVFVNNSNTSLTQFTLSYTGERWRSGSTANNNTLHLEYLVGASGIANGTFTPVTALNFTDPDLGFDTSLDGNASANQTTLSATVVGINWAPGQTLVVRWRDPDETGTDDGVAIDNLTFSATVSPLGLFVPANQTGFSDKDMVFSSEWSRSVAVGGVGNLSLALNVANGTLSMGAGNLTITGNGSGSIVANGTLTDLNSALANLTFTPTPVFQGSTALQLAISDANTTMNATVGMTLSNVFINEILFNPPGTDEMLEYVEIRSSLPNFVFPTGTFLAGIEGDTTGGDVQNLFSLAGKSTGSNGYMVLLQANNNYVPDSNASVYTNTVGNGFGGTGTSNIGHSGDSGNSPPTDIENASVTFMLFQAPAAPTMNTDIDSDNNGAIDGAATSWVILDSIGVLDTGATDIGYGTINFANGNGGVSATGSLINNGNFTGGYVARVGNSTGSSSNDWVVAEIAGDFTLTNTTFPTTVSGALDHLGATNSFTALIAPQVNFVGGASYTENANATPLNANLTVSDGDSTTLVSATVAITSNFIPGQDILAFTPTGNINGTFSNGTLTLTGNDTLANYQTVLRSITYSNPSENPSTANRTISFTLNDGATTGTQYLTLSVIAVNDAGVLTTSGGNASFTGAGAITIDSNVTLSDIDSANLTGANITLTNFFAGQDVLGFANTANITGSFNATTGVLTLTGNDTLTAYQTALRSVTYNNTLGSGNTTPRVVAFQFNDGGAVNNLSNVGNKTVELTMTGAQPVFVQSVTQTTTGFTVQFNRPVQAGLVNLYDQGGSLGASDVTLVGTNTGSVRGSLFFNAGNTTATFIKTGPTTLTGAGAAFGTLAPDTYTLTLRSAANGFVDLDGNLLRDANGSVAGDYVSTFNISAPANGTVTVAIPDFARGFNQTVNVPNTATGLPLLISNGNNVGGVDLTLNYNPALLNITDFTTTIPGASTGISFPQPGTIIIQVSSATAFASVNGPLTLGTFTATIPAAAPYAAKELLDITSLLVVDASAGVNEIPSLADDAIHIAAFFGDLNGSQTYSSADTILIQRLGLAVNSGTSAFQLADPVLVGDINYSNTFTSADTIFVQRLGLGIGVANVPALPAGTVATGGPDPILFIPTSLSGSAGNATTIPVNVTVTEPTGVTIAGVDFVMTYDPAKLTIAPTGAVTVGSMLSGANVSSPFSFGYQIPTPGTIRIQGSTGGTSVNFANGTTANAFNIAATINANATSGPTQLNILASDGTITTAMLDNDVNELVLLPAPTNGAADSVDGTLTITGAGNAAPTVTPANNTLAYTENAGNITLDNTFVVNDTDSANLTTATITFTGGFVSGQDVLVFSNQSGITGSFNASNGTLTLTGNATLANYQTALRSISYRNDSENPATANRTLSVIVHDGTDPSAAVTRTITVAVVNDAPTLTPANGSLAYTQNANATVIDNTFTLADVDSTNLTGATITFTGGFASGQDVLNFVDQNGINGTFNASNGTLTLTGNTTLANYQTAMRSITFNSNSSTPGNRTLSLVVNDGAGVNNLSTAVARTITVSAAGQTLAVGDIAILGYRSDAPDTFAFVTWVDILAGTSIRFWDSGYIGGGDGTGQGTGGGTWRASENFATWTNSTGSTIVAGTVVVIQDPSAANGTADLGSVVGNLSGISAGTDQLFAGQGSFVPGGNPSTWNGTLIFGLDFNGSAGWDASATSTGTSALPSVLDVTGGNTFFGGGDNRQYSGSRNFANIAAAQTAVRDTANYTFNNDGAIFGNVDSTDFSFVANNAPTVTPANGNLTYTENANATIIDSTFVLTDDGATLTGANISFAGGYFSGQDVLGFVNNANITGSFNATTGTLTLTGNTTLANYQAALNSITYVNNSENPSTANRTLSITVNDGAQDSSAVTRTISVIAVNDAPVVTATLANGTFNVGGGPIVVDSALSVTDIDSANLIGGTIFISINFTTGQDVLAFVNTANITGSYNASNGTLTLTGTDTVANYQSALRSITYNNTSGTPNFSPRTISFQVNDGAGANNLSNVATRIIEVVAAPNTAPTLTPANGTLAYTENAGALILDNTFVVADDGASIAGATVTITGGYVNGQDVLGFVTQNGINGTFDAGNGTLTLTGTTTLANYQTALRSITYLNNSENPSTANRTVSIVINDGSLASTAVTRNITVASVNDVPAFNAPAATTGLANGSITFSAANGNAISLTDLDVGTGNLTLTLNTSNGNLSMTGANLSLSGNGTSNITATGSLADLNAALNGLRLTPAAGFTGSASLQLNVNDLGNSGGSAQQANATIGLTVAQIYINEILFNPPGTDSPNEYVEIRSSIPNFTLPAGTFLAGIEGDAGTGSGDIQNLFDLSGKATGSNGILVILQKGATYTPNANATVFINSGTGNGFGSGAGSSIGHTGDSNQTDIENTNNSFILFQGAPPLLTDDIDANDDGVPDGVYTSWNVQDSVGILNNSAPVGSRVYGQVNFATSAVPFGNTVIVPFTSGYVARIGNSTGFTAADWAASDNATGAAPNFTLATGGAAGVTPGLLSLAPLNHIGAPNNWVAPPQVALSNATLTYTENAGPIALDANLTVSDFDSTILTGANLTFTGGYVSGQDVLSFSPQNGISGTFDAANGTLVLTGNATLANYQTALRSITFINNSENPSTANRTLAINVSDGTFTSTITNETIVVVAVNDAPTVNANQSFALDENSANGSIVGTVLASDVDGSTFTGWTITGGNTNGAFAINPANGSITVANGTALDREATAGFTLQVTVSDGANTSLAQNVAINLNNLNDVTPVVGANQTFALNENSANGSFVGTLAATDGDVGNTTLQSWTITGGNNNGAFAINPANGTITVANGTALDREATAGFTLQVTVSDGLNTSATQNVTVNLNNLNDVTPVVSANQTFALNENSANGSFVGTLAATDGDVGNTTLQSWTITGGNNNGAFAINPANGTITVANGTALDREATAGFTLQVTVSDGLNTSASQNVTVNLNNLNDATPVVGANQTFAVNSAAANGSVVGSLIASDGDVGVTTFQSWTITGGNTGSAFALNPSNGTLTVANNASLAGSFNLLITVSDGVNASAAETVVVNVTVANTAPTLTPANGTVAYTENAGAITLDNTFLVGDDGGTIAGATLTFTGGYVGGQDTLGFSNQSGISGVFNAGNGTLTLTGNATLANYQTALRSITYTNNSENPATADRTLSITLSDGSLSSTPVARTITVAAVNDAPTVTTTASNATFNVGAAAILIDSGLSLADFDSAMLAGASITITGNYMNGQDVLGFINQNGINGTFTAANGTLSLAGNATLAHYQTALRSITYNNTSGTPSLAQRTVSFQVDDGAAANNLSNVATRNISLFSASNVAPVLTTTDLNFSYAANTSLATLSATDSDPLSYSATIDSVGHYLRSTFNLTFPAGNLAGLTTGAPSPANLYYNYGGKQDKWIASPSGWFIILPNGDFYRWSGHTNTANMAAGFQKITVSPIYWQNPGRIRDEVMGEGPIDFSVSGSQLTFDNPTHFEGQFRVTATVTDGALFDTKSFFVNFTNLAPSLEPIANQSMPPTQDTITVVLVAADAESDTLTLSATVQSQVQIVKASIGSKQPATLGMLFDEFSSNNYGRLGEKWLSSRDLAGNKVYFYILPTGDLFRWDGTPNIAQGSFVAHVGTNVYATPSLLINPLNPPATTSSADSNLTIDPAAGFRGNLIVTARVTDTRGNVTSRVFTVSVAPAPTLTQPANISINGPTATPITLNATDPSGLTLTYSVVSEALLLKTTYNLSFSGNLYTNFFGLGEKWLLGAGPANQAPIWYYVTPAGQLYRWQAVYGNSVGQSTFVRTIDTRYHTNPALLYNAHTQATFSIVGNTLTVTPTAGFTGTLVLTVYANNGVFQDSKTFTLTVN